MAQFHMFHRPGSPSNPADSDYAVVMLPECVGTFWPASLYEGTLLVAASTADDATALAQEYLVSMPEPATLNLDIVQQPAGPDVPTQEFPPVEVRQRITLFLRLDPNGEIAEDQHEALEHLIGSPFEYALILRSARRISRTLNIWRGFDDALVDLVAARLSIVREVRELVDAA